MGTWVVPADLLARSRFVVSPLNETVAALTVLSRPDPPGIPWQRGFRAAAAGGAARRRQEDKPE